MALVFFLQFCWSISLQTEQLLNLLMRVVRKDPMGWDNAVLRGKLIGARGDRFLNQLFVRSLQDIQPSRPSAWS